MSELEDARSGLHAKLQELFRELGIDLSAPGDARSPAERLAQAAFPDLEPRAAKHALEDLWRQESRWAAMEDERMRARAADLERAWKVFDPALRLTLEQRAAELGVPVSEVKTHLLIGAEWELERADAVELPEAASGRWLDRPYTAWHQKAVIALAEAALRAEAPLLRARPHDPDYPLEAALASDPVEDAPEALPADDEPLSSRALPPTLPPALAAYLRHALDHPGLSDAERERDLGKRPGWCKQQRHRLRARLGRQV